MFNIHRLQTLSIILSGLLLAACGGGGSGDGGGDNTAIIDSARTALNDKLISFSTFGSNSDADAFLSGSRDLALCEFGRFGLNEFLSFSSNVGSFPIEDESSGTWSVSAQNCVTSVDLLIDDSTDTSLTLPVQRSFSVQVDANGSVFVNGVAADVQDIAAECAAAQSQFPI